MTFSAPRHLPVLSCERQHGQKVWAKYSLQARFSLPIDCIWLTYVPIVLLTRQNPTWSRLCQSTACIRLWHWPNPSQHAQLPGGDAFYPLSCLQVAAHRARWVECMEGGWKLELKPHALEQELLGCSFHPTWLGLWHLAYVPMSVTASL